ncbi:uncharacterized protein [Anabrus simplex]|uniref:uncharacterized protein n=1 Tax=Anabrus simplex TaxID=316456 RepID=UPI0035A2EAEB
MREDEEGMALEETTEEAQGLLGPPLAVPVLKPSPSSSGRNQLSVTILELGSSSDNDPDKLSSVSGMSGGLELPSATPSGATPERRESANSTRSIRSGAGLGAGDAGRGSDVIVADSNSDTFGPGGLDPRTLLQERPTWEARYFLKEHRRAGKATFQGEVYNFLERPSGWKCFVYHFSV